MAATTGDSRYIALTTYRRDGRPVTTPVWAVTMEGKYYVFTTNSTGKAKRVRATGRVRFAPCSMNGRRSASMAGSCRWRCSSTGCVDSIANVSCSS